MKTKKIYPFILIAGLLILIILFIYLSPKQIILTNSDKSFDLGNLSITIINYSNYSYYAADNSGKLIKKEYYAFYLKIFNTFSRNPGVYSLEDNEAIKFTLVDNINKNYLPLDYEPNYNADIVLIKNFEKILPQQIHEGYLLFPKSNSGISKIILKNNRKEVTFKL